MDGVWDEQGSRVGIHRGPAGGKQGASTWGKHVGFLPGRASVRKSKSHGEPGQGAHHARSCSDPHHHVPTRACMSFMHWHVGLDTPTAPRLGLCAASAGVRSPFPKFPSPTPDQNGQPTSRPQPRLRSVGTQQGALSQTHSDRHEECGPHKDKGAPRGLGRPTQAKEDSGDADERKG